MISPTTQVDTFAVNGITEPAVALGATRTAYAIGLPGQVPKVGELVQTCP